MFFAGMRTSSKNTSQKSTPPCIMVSGRGSMPGVFIGISRYEMPACLVASGSVRNKPNIMSDSVAWLVQIFWPLSSHSSPTRWARDWSEARSLPEPGSL